MEGLRLDSREALLRGGDSGPAIVPGKPDESLLIRAVRHTDDEFQDAARRQADRPADCRPGAVGRDGRAVSRRNSG